MTKDFPTRLRDEEEEKRNGWRRRRIIRGGDGGGEIRAEQSDKNKVTVFEILPSGMGCARASAPLRHLFSQ